MRDLDMTSLRLFVAVCEARSISRVAADETIVVSAISKRLTQLENSVGTKLLRRGKAGVNPTPAGETLLQHAYELRDKLSEIERDMSQHAEIVRGRVRLFAAATAVGQFLPDDLASFLQVPEHQHIRIDLEEHLSHRVVFGVREGLAQLGICWDEVDCEGLQTREYRYDQLGVAVHRLHPLASLGSVAIRETLGYDHIGTHPSPAGQPTMPKALRMDMPVRYRAVVSSFDTALRLSHAGLGIAVVPLEIVRNYRRAEEVAFIPLSDSWARRRFIVCARDFVVLTRAARLLLEHLARPVALPESTVPQA